MSALGEIGCFRAARAAAMQKHEQEQKARELQAEVDHAKWKLRQYQEELAAAEKAALFEKQRIDNLGKAKECATVLRPNIVASIANSPDASGSYWWYERLVNSIKSCHGLDRDRDIVPAVLD